MVSTDSEYYDLGSAKPFAPRSSTDGYQAKFIVNGGKQFLKLQCVLHGQQLKDPWVEVIASTLAERVGIPCVKQKFASARWRGLGYVGVVSDIFSDEFYSYSRMTELNGEDIKNSEYNSLCATDKVTFLAHNMARYTQSDVGLWCRYLRNMMLLDILVGNNDRHFHNFGSFNLAAPALLFDNGMGMFVDCPDYYTFDDCMQQLYIQPWSEDPFDLIAELNLQHSCAGLQWEDLLYLCPSNNAKRYFTEVMQLVT